MHKTGVLKDVLARIPADDETEATGALADLKRMCCSTSYMFMYSQVRPWHRHPIPYTTALPCYSDSTSRIYIDYIFM